MAQGSPWKLACYYAVIDSHCDFIIAVGRVKVRRLMIAVKHADHDSQEAADFEHEQILAPNALIAEPPNGPSSAVGPSRVVAPNHQPRFHHLSPAGGKPGPLRCTRC
jgi:hypothetical protein